VGNKRCFWMVILSVVAFAFYASPAFAQFGGHPGEFGGPGPWAGMPPPEMVVAVAAELGITDAVLKDIKERIFKADQDVIGLRAELEVARLELRRLLDEDRPDIAKIMHQVDVVAEAEKQVHKNRVRLDLAVRELLTPDQRHQLFKHPGPMEKPSGNYPGPGTRPDMGPGHPPAGPRPPPPAGGFPAGY
jgi:Spy/CpxP family protein refolding chaperone